ncbi:MAG TPA: hypothetical protein VFZ65_21510 [Planctomycetota bacterium]|nr:hypothetical protein [Planctomycetota bacterium]
MASAKKTSKATATWNDAILSFEATPWQAAAVLRNDMDVAEYKHIVLGLFPSGGQTAGMRQTRR